MNSTKTQTEKVKYGKEHRENKENDENIYTNIQKTKNNL